jgi:DNA processing protein
VFAVPGSPLDPRAEGTNDLLREGAHLCARAEDVLAVIDPLRAHDPFAVFREDEPDPSEPMWGEQPLFGVDPGATPRARPREAMDEATPPSFDVGEDATIQRVEEMLGPSPVSLDELALVADLDVRQVRMAVLVLDLAGKIEHSGGDRVALRLEADRTAR